MSKVVGTIKDKEASSAIRKCLNEAAFHCDPTMPYKIIADAFAGVFVKQNPKFNAQIFVKKCTSDYNGNPIYCHN